MSEEQAVRQAQRSRAGTVRALVPARYSAWLSGDLGWRVLRDLNAAILDVHPVPELVVRRIASGVVVQGHEDAGPFVGSLAEALVAVELAMRTPWPLMHAELGSLFTGSLQVLLPHAEFHGPWGWPSGAGPGGPPQPGR